MGKASFMLRKSLIPQASLTTRVCASDIAITVPPATGEPAPTALAELPYEWLFTAASQAVLIVKIATGAITAANPAAAVLLATTRSALVGTRLIESVDQCGARTLENSLADAVEAGSDQRIALRARRGGAQLAAKVS